MTTTRRRFQDFTFLREHLSKDFPAAVVPPLPGKHRLEYVTGDRFATEFIDRRKLEYVSSFFIVLTTYPDQPTTVHGSPLQAPDTPTCKAPPRLLRIDGVERPDARSFGAPTRSRFRGWYAPGEPLGHTHQRI